MASLKNRRAAHRLVAEVLWSYTRSKAMPPEGAPELRDELERIREAHFAAGTQEDGEGELEVLEPGALAFGGVKPT